MLVLDAKHMISIVKIHISYDENYRNFYST